MHHELEEHEPPHELVQAFLEPMLMKEKHERKIKERIE